MGLVTAYIWERYIEKFDLVEEGETEDREQSRRVRAGMMTFEQDGHGCECGGPPWSSGRNHRACKRWGQGQLWGSLLVPSSHTPRGLGIKQGPQQRDSKGEEKGEDENLVLCVFFSNYVGQTGGDSSLLTELGFCQVWMAK